MNQKPRVVFIEGFVTSEQAEEFSERYSNEFDVQVIQSGGRFDLLWLKTGGIETADVVVYPYYSVKFKNEQDEWTTNFEAESSNYFSFCLREVASIRKTPVPIIFFTKTPEKCVGTYKKKLDCDVEVDIVAFKKEEDGFQTLAALIKKRSFQPLDVQSIFPDAYFTFYKMGFFGSSVFLLAKTYGLFSNK